MSVHFLSPGGKEMDTYGHLWKSKGRARGAENTPNFMKFHEAGGVSSTLGGTLRFALEGTFQGQPKGSP